MKPRDILIKAIKDLGPEWKGYIDNIPEFINKTEEVRPSTILGASFIWADTKQSWAYWNELQKALYQREVEILNKYYGKKDTKAGN
jgi:hypothetical protein